MPDVNVDAGVVEQTLSLWLVPLHDKVAEGKERISTAQWDRGTLRSYIDYYRRRLSDAGYRSPQPVEVDLPKPTEAPIDPVYLGELVKLGRAFLEGRLSGQPNYASVSALNVDVACRLYESLATVEADDEVEVIIR